jgi:CDP-diacylglycerol--glycerol-3-phosphate 3-phosphatidyltransferase
MVLPARGGPVKITANQVTLLRLVFLPAPCALLFGGPWEKALALLLFILIGLTDYLDGYLARKQGPTTLGAVMDPMVDKIFVTAMFVPLASMHVVPIWLVLLLFIREYVVTELRSIHGSRGVHFQTSELAKYKTTIQMIGGGVIILNEIFRSHWGALVPLTGFFVFTLGLALRTHRQRDRFGPRIITFVVLVGWVLLTRCLFSHTTTIMAVMVLIVSVTLLSGLQYVVQTWKHMGRSLRAEFGAMESASFLGISVVFPVIYVSALYTSEVSPWLIIAILSLEFAGGGLNNLQSTLGASSPYIPQMGKSLLVNGAGLLGLLLLLWIPGSARLSNVLLLVALAASLVYCLKSFYIHRRALLGAPHASA